MTRSSSRTWDSRELPEGARQSETDGELALEQPTESRELRFSPFAHDTNSIILLRFIGKRRVTIGAGFRSLADSVADIKKKTWISLGNAYLMFSPFAVCIIETFRSHRPKVTSFSLYLLQHRFNLFDPLCPDIGILLHIKHAFNRVTHTDNTSIISKRL